MSSLVAMMMTGTKMRKANPPRFCNAATISLINVHRDNALRFSIAGFFHESVFPKPLSIPSGPFQIFAKIHGAIGMTSPVLLTLVANGRNLEKEKFSIF
jgi:hypothetical protein